MLNASRKSPPDVLRRNVVPTLDHSLADAPDGFAHIRDPDKVQFDCVAALLCCLENAHIGSSAQCRFKRKCFATLDQFVKFAQEQSARFECNYLWPER